MSKTQEPWEIGLDGYPTDPRHPCYRAKSRTSQQLHDDYLAALQRDGRLTALRDAIGWCRRHQLPLPDWAADCVLMLLQEPKRLAKMIGADRRNRIHLARWDLVADCVTATPSSRARPPILSRPYLPPMTTPPRRSRAVKQPAPPTQSRRVGSGSNASSVGAETTFSLGAGLGRRSGMG